MNVDLRDQVALITGGAHGIGRAAAQILADNGAQVVIADIDRPAMKSVASKLSGSVPLHFDVSSESSVVEGVSQIGERFGRIDILVNNAGINTVDHRVTIDQLPVGEWDSIMDVDLRGAFLVSRAVSSIMLGPGSGRIINIASVVGFVPVRLQSAYNAAKAGLINLTRSMALEMAPNGISVNCVAPGSIQTAMTRNVFYGKGAAMSKRAQRLIDHIPMGRPGSPEDVAQAILFFSARETGYITGQTLSVDGGWSTGGFLRDF